MSPLVRREAVELLFSRRDRLEHLLSALESKELAAGEIDPGPAQAIANPHQDDSSARGQSGSSAAESSARAIGRRRIAALPAGPCTGRQAGRGAAVFLKVCATCHRAGGQGVDVGPDLATVAGRSPEDLLLHMLDPNREVAPNYVNYNVATTDGR